MSNVRQHSINVIVDEAARSATIESSRVSPVTVSPEYAPPDRVQSGMIPLRVAEGGFTDTVNDR